MAATGRRILRPPVFVVNKRKTPPRDLKKCLEGPAVVDPSNKSARSTVSIRTEKNGSLPKQDKP